MAVLSAAVVTTGKALVARQFVEMTRLRAQGLISAFQGLVCGARDHSCIETEAVGYVYQPMESLHLLLVTNKSSSVLEDLGTLRLLAAVVRDCCQTRVNELAVRKHALDIVFAFDEVISCGHRASVTLPQVRSYTQVDSEMEQYHRIIEWSKLNEAREMAKKRQKQIELEKRQQEAKSNPSAPQMTQETPAARTPSMNDVSCATIKRNTLPEVGMVLGKTKPRDIFAGLGSSKPSPEEPQAATSVLNPFLEPVKVVIHEKVTAELEVEGGLNGVATCNGSFEVAVLDPSRADLVCFKLAPPCQDFKYKVHPSLNKASHANNLLEVRPGQSAFPTGSCLKWQLKTSDDNFLPVTTCCWLMATGDGTQIVFELELIDNDAVLEDVLICFPASASSRPSVVSASPGDASYEDGHVRWRIPVFDASNGSGTLEFSADDVVASLLPATFQAEQRGTARCPMEILECYHQARKDAVSFACDKKVTYAVSIGS